MVRGLLGTQKVRRRLERGLVTWREKGWDWRERAVEIKGRKNREDVIAMVHSWATCCQDRTFA